jgi:hypothetical protein
MHRACLLLIPLCCLLPPQLAHAQRSAQDSQRIRDLVREGFDAFDSQRYKLATRAWSDAYALSGDPELLYRIGQAQEQLGNLKRAQEYTTAYLAQAPANPYAAQIQARINDLGKRAEREQAYLEISSSPPGATIRIDGMLERAKTPATLPVASGPITVELIPQRGQPSRDELATNPGSTLRHQVNFDAPTEKPTPEPEPEPEPEPTVETPAPTRPEEAPPEVDQLTIVDVRPPTGIYILGWTGLCVGSMLFIVGGLIDLTDFGNEFTPVWVIGLAATGLGGYLLFSHDWASDLPTASASPTHAIPIARTLNIKLAF